MIRVGRVIGATMAAEIAVVAVPAVAMAAEVTVPEVPVPVSPGVARLHTETEPEAGGTHLRVETAHGPVHLFVPGGYRRRDAGVVVYVHGLYVTVDAAWGEHRLAEQVAASGRNAIFSAPAAPATANEEA